MAGAPGRQGRHRARHDRPRAEGRRGVSTCASPTRRRTSTPCASPPAKPTLVLGCDMRCPAPSPRARTCSSRPPTSSPRCADRAGDGRDALARRRDATGHRAAGRCHRRQPVHARLCVAAGLVPISHDALMRAVELNGAAIEDESRGVRLGPFGRVDLPAVICGRRRQRAQPKPPRALKPLGRPPNGPANPGRSGQRLRSADELADVQRLNAHERDSVPADGRHCACRVRWTSASRAASPSSPTTRTRPTRKRYDDLVSQVRAAEANKAPGSTALSEAVARYAFKLMAYKDEYEVARLYTSARSGVSLRAAVRRRLHAALPPRPAAVGEEGRAGPADQARIRPVDVHRVQADGETALPARRRVRYLRLHRRTQDGTPVDRRLFRPPSNACSAS
jgi:hypothetical protein